MTPRRNPLLWFCRRVDRFIMVFFGLCGGLALAQFPQYLAQYLQRLGGHVDEARLAAKLFALPALSVRADQMAEGLRAIADSSALFKLPAFLARANWVVAREALREFTPGITFAREELCYLTIGTVLGIAVYGAGKLFVLGIAKILRRLGDRSIRPEYDGKSSHGAPTDSVDQTRPERVPSVGEEIDEKSPMTNILCLFRLGTPAWPFAVVRKSSTHPLSIVHLSEGVYDSLQAAGIPARDRVTVGPVSLADVAVLCVFQFNLGTGEPASYAVGTKEAGGTDIMPISDAVFDFLRSLGVYLCPLVSTT